MKYIKTATKINLQKYRQRQRKQHTIFVSRFSKIDFVYEVSVFAIKYPARNIPWAEKSFYSCYFFTRPAASLLHIAMACVDIEYGNKFQSIGRFPLIDNWFYFFSFANLRQLWAEGQCFFFRNRTHSLAGAFNLFNRETSSTHAIPLYVSIIQCNHTMSLSRCCALR